jgi:DNA topoisomerase II
MSDSDNSDNDSKKLTVEEKYKKMKPIEHILKRPDSYVGSVDTITELMRVYDDDRIIIKNITYIPALFKIFDEVLVNMYDASIVLKTCTMCKVDIDMKTGYISAWNNGEDGIPVVMHKEHKIMVPELIFGNLLSSSNYGDNEKRITGGKNGYGAKLANIYSKVFEIEIVDNTREKKYIQKFYDNMSKKDEPKITKCTNKSYVKITFLPDYKRFGLEGLTKDIFILFKKRVYDINACANKNVRMYFNGEKLDKLSFQKYISTFYPEDEKIKCYYEEPHKRWQIGVVFDPAAGFTHVSYVNGINTNQGGTHVEYVVNQICNKLRDVIQNKHKDLKIKLPHIRDNLTVFINCSIENPNFDSQTKSLMKSLVSKFGSKCEVSDALISKIAKSGIVDEVIKIAQIKQAGELKRTDGKKNGCVSDIPKLLDAQYAGGKHSKEARLILTEGDSAKATALSGIAVIGSARFGIFPLRGKLLNVRNASDTEIKNNAEITHIKRIMGLQQNVDYSDLSKLRYGGIIILTDQDVDGFHIKGLIMNFLHYYWPSLLKHPNFVTSLATPIAKASKGTKKNKQVKCFFSLPELNKWIKDEGTNNEPPKGWSVKHYKGLGTHNKEEARECFRDIFKKLISYCAQGTKNDSDSDSSDSDSSDSDSSDEELKMSSGGNKKIIDPNKYHMDLAFYEKMADPRKEWLKSYNKNSFLDNSKKVVYIPEFINNDLIQFSNYDNIRSIPCMVDGFKPALRKVLRGSRSTKLTTNEKSEVKVEELSSDITKLTRYHHGGSSMIGTIVGMAQDFMGSNNINLLIPDGQFGTRNEGGKDASAARYINTYFTSLTPLIFKDVDEPILLKQFDEGYEIEPEFYVPIIPMILVNGTEGIGTGYSTKIPPYNPKEIIDNILKKLNGEDMKPMKPWYRGFLGNIKKINKNAYEIIAKYQISKDDPDVLHILDLPAGMWTENYITFLKSLLNEGNEKKYKVGQTLKFLGYNPRVTDINAAFDLYFEKGALAKHMKNETEFIKKLKLVKPIKTTNMHLYTHECKIKKYNSPMEIMNDYYKVRVDFYEKRRQYQISKLKIDNELLKWKIKFIKAVNDDKIIVSKSTRKKITERLEELKFPMLSKNPDKDTKSYDYALTLSLLSLTQEVIDKLEKELKENQDEIDYLTNTTAEKMWKKELTEFSKDYDDWYTEWTENNEKNRYVVSDKSKHDTEFVGKIKSGKLKITKMGKKGTKESTKTIKKKKKFTRVQKVKKPKTKSKAKAE